MKVLICDSQEAAIERAAGLIVRHIADTANAVLGLATGGTMLPLYERLVALYRAQQVSFSGVTSFNLDEYVGLAPEHPCSYHRYMKDALFSQIRENRCKFSGADERLMSEKSGVGRHER